MHSTVVLWSRDSALRLSTAAVLPVLALCTGARAGAPTSPPILTVSQISSWYARHKLAAFDEVVVRMSARATTPSRLAMLFRYLSHLMRRRGNTRCRGGTRSHLHSEASEGCSASFASRCKRARPNLSQASLSRVRVRSQQYGTQSCATMPSRTGNIPFTSTSHKPVSGQSSAVPGVAVPLAVSVSTLVSVVRNQEWILRNNTRIISKFGFAGLGRMQRTSRLG